MTIFFGLIDDFYSHGFGDIDYSLRASKAGINVYLSNFAVGVCEPNPRDDRVKSFRNKSFKERFKIMNSVYYRPIKDWYHFTKKFGGKLWLLRFIAPYIKLALNIY